MNVSGKPEERLRVAVVLSASGGFLDAFTWVAHGGVFANAQSGNVVLLGVFTALGEWRQALRHVPPIVAFLLGLFVADRLRVFAARHERLRVPLLSLAIELLLLAVVALLPAPGPDLPVVLGIAFVAALQTSSFAHVEGSAYSSVMTTGNLRRAAESLFAGLTTPRDAAKLRQAQVFATICCAFALGSALGAFATARLANVALLIPIGTLMAAFFLCL